MTSPAQALLKAGSSRLAQAGLLKQSQLESDNGNGLTRNVNGSTPYSDETQRAVSTLISLQLERGFGLDGALFLLDQENTVEPVWGTERQCLWSVGEPLYVAAGPGRGKTTLCQQLALRRAGVLSSPLLDLPVATDARRVLYVAADRPRQAARSWRRMVTEKNREALELSIVVWPLGLPFMISAQPEKLLPWIESFGEIGTVFIDSLFNVAPSMADEEGAANTNNALQSVIRAGIEIVVIHHDRKATAERKIARMDDVYGGRALTGGAGSILYLDGEPGTMRSKLRHLKQPAAPVGPLDLWLDPRKGEFTVEAGER